MTTAPWVLLALLGAGLLLWWVSLRRDDVSIVDIFWGPAFLLIVGVTVAQVGWPAPRGALVALLVSVWGARLGAYLRWRNHGQPEDRRYQAMRSRRGPSFRRIALFQVFWLQGLLAFVISAPVQVGLQAPGSPWTAVDAAALLLFATGFAFETVGDWQLARFKADPKNKGQVMDQGLWRLTRHPNYFGDFCIWWSFFLFVLPLGGWALASVVGPLVMSVLLLRVSGVSLLEADIGERRPAYREYIRRTSAFFPWPPRPANRELPSGPGSDLG